VQDALCLLFLGLMLYEGIFYTIDGMSQFSPLLRVPIGLIFVTIPISAFSSIVFIVHRRVTKAPYQVRFEFRACFDRSDEALIYCRLRNRSDRVSAKISALDVDRSIHRLRWLDKERWVTNRLPTDKNTTLTPAQAKMMQLAQGHGTRCCGHSGGRLSGVSYCSFWPTASVHDEARKRPHGSSARAAAMPD
jgi:hypothetical protein